MPIVPNDFARFFSLLRIGWQATAWLVVAGLPAYGDVVFLKNGNEIQGTIRRIDSSKVVMELEYGTITLDRHDVKSLRRGKNTIGGRGGGTGNRVIPLRLKKTSDAIRQLEGLRSRALSASRDQRGQQRELEEARDQLERTHSEYLEAQQKLRETPARPVRKYNEQVREVNRLSGDMASLRTQIEGLEGSRRSENSAIPDYSHALQKVSANLAKTRRALQRSGWRKGEKEYLQKANNTLKEMRRDFQSIEVHVTPAPGDHVIVPVEINRSVIGYFMVDTGASVVSFSRQFAQKLRLDLENAQVTRVVLADGKRVQARRITLSSVRVGSARADNVEAVVLPRPPGAKIDGLLGMSFLRNFMMEMQGNKMILRKMR